MNSLLSKLIVCAGAVIFLAGCAHQSASGNAPGSVSGKASSAKHGEFYNTETITPGVGSALFPDPSWR